MDGVGGLWVDWRTRLVRPMTIGDSLHRVYTKHGSRLSRAQAVDSRCHEVEPHETYEE